MMSAIKMSVVVPTFMRVALLRRLLESLCLQTCPSHEYEVVIVSDGPDPQTAALVSQFNGPCPEIRFHSLPVKSGPAAARNAGWQMSKGELIVFTDDDCIPAPDWLDAYQRACNLQKLHKPFCMTGKVQVPISPLPTDYEKNVGHLATAEFITANCACSRSALEMVGGFDEAFPIAWREDSDLQFKFLSSGIPISHVPEALVCHPVREAKWGVSISDQRKSMFNALLFKKHPALYKQRISAGPVWNYYLIIFLSFASLIAWLAGAVTVLAFCLSGWVAATGFFALRRLKGTSSALSHRLEMIVTSIAIPYLSVYWTLRGAWKYKVFFL